MILRLFLALLALQVPQIPGNAYAQQSSPNYSPQSHTPQTYTPQTYSPPGYSPPGYAPQTGTEAQSRPTVRTRRLFHCVSDEDASKYCSFYSYRELRSGNPCTCDGKQGSIY